MLRVQDVKKSYPGREGPQPVLRGVSLNLQAGESLALTGESGSGKSTLLHLIGALDGFDFGEISLEKSLYSRLSEPERALLRRDRIGLIFQQFNLIPSLNVERNLSFQARLSGRHDAALTEHLAERLGLSDLLRRYPEELSGGQQQRVAIGRALAARPQLVLADEPTGNLDEATGDAVLELMLELATASGAGLLMVTHSMRLAGRLSRRLHLSHGLIEEL